MSSGIVYRGRHLIQPSTRSLNARIPTIDESVTLDFSKGVSENVKEIIDATLNVQELPKLLRLGYLNNFVRLLNKFPFNDSWRFTLRHMLLWLRCLLCDSEREIRAAALRILRYLPIRNEVDMKTLTQLKIDYFIARCLDIVLDNHVERLQVVRFVAKVTNSCPSAVPSSLIRPLIAIASEGLEERDKLTRASLAILCELTVNCPSIVLGCGNLTWLIKSLFISNPLHVTEAVVAVLSYLTEKPITRVQPKVRCLFQELFAPLLDPYFRPSVEFAELATDGQFSKSNEETKDCLSQCRLTLVAVLRSWPLLLMSLMPIANHSSPLRALVQGLYIKHADIQKTVLNILYDTFFISWKTEAFNSWEDLLEFARCPADSQAFSLSQGYICEEAKFVLPSLCSDRFNLTEQYFSFLLFCLVEAGLLQGLSYYAMSSSSDQTSLKCTYLLSQLVVKGRRSLPFSRCCNAFEFPLLMHTALDIDQTCAMRDNAQQLISHIEDLTNCLWQRHRCINAKSLALQMLLRRANCSKPINFPIGFTVMGRNAVHDCIKASRVLSPYTSYGVWDWGLIESVLYQMKSDARQTTDSTCLKFLQGLLHFYRPVSGSYHKLQEDFESYTKVGCLLFAILGSADPETSCHSLLKDFAADLVIQLQADRLYIGMFSTRNIVATASRDYFILLGEISSTEYGRQTLENVYVFQKLFDIININTDDIYVKLIVSNLDYSRAGITRIILSKCLTSTKESCRVYATEYLRTIGRISPIGVEQRWLFECLVGQLHDSSLTVLQTAVSVLDELLQRPAAIHCLLELRPSLLSLGDAGILLATYLVSTPTGFRKIQQCSPNFIENEVDRWLKEFNCRYVDIVEEGLHESLTEYKRTQRGTFGRRSTSKRKLAELFIPPHLFGKLGSYEDGIECLQKFNCIQKLTEVIHDYSSLLVSANGILNLKAAVWAVANIASTDVGFSAVPAGLILQIVNMAESCEVYSLKGCAFYAAGLVAQSNRGAQYLGVLGWEAPRLGPVSCLGVSFCSNHTTSCRSENVIDQSSRIVTSATSNVSDLMKAADDTPAPSRLVRLVNGNAAVPAPIAASIRSKTASESIHSYVETSALSTPIPRCSSASSRHRVRVSSEAESAFSVNSCTSCELCRVSAVAETLKLSRFDESLIPEPLDVKSTVGDGDSILSSKCARSKSLDASSCQEAASWNATDERCESADSSFPPPMATCLNIVPTTEAANVIETYSYAQLPVANLTATIASRNCVDLKTQRSLSCKNAAPLIAHIRSQSFGGVWTHDNLWLQQQGVGIEGAFVAECRSSGIGRRHNKSFLDETLTSGFCSVDSLCLEAGVSNYCMADSQAINKYYGSSLSPVPCSPLMASPMFDRKSVDQNSVQRKSIMRLKPELPANFATDNEMRRAVTYNGPFNEENNVVYSSSKNPWFWYDFCCREMPNSTCIPISVGVLIACDLERAALAFPELSSATSFAIEDVQKDDSHVFGLSDHLKEQCLKCSGSQLDGSGLIGATVEATSPTQKLVRKEVFRLITLLNVRKKYSETGLLRLRQEHASFFQSLCNYCDVAFLLESYQFRLIARRFLQELFQDIDFSPVTDFTLQSIYC